MLNRIIALTPLVALLGVVACGDDGTQEGQDASTMSADASHRTCPEQAAFITATGQLNGVDTSTTPSRRIMKPFTVSSDLSGSDDLAIYRVATGEGQIETVTVEHPDMSVYIDILKEPVEGTYTDDVETVKVRVIDKGTGFTMLGQAPNVSSHVITITCWDPDGLRLDGTFSATWFEDTSGGSLIPLGYGDLLGEFSVTLTSM